MDTSRGIDWFMVSRKAQFIIWNYKCQIQREGGVFYRIFLWPYSFAVHMSLIFCIIFFVNFCFRSVIQREKSRQMFYSSFKKEDHNLINTVHANDPNSKKIYGEMGMFTDLARKEIYNIYITWKLLQIHTTPNNIKKHWKWTWKIRASWTHLHKLVHLPALALVVESKLGNI